LKEIEERVEVLTVRQAGDRLDVYVAGNSDLSRARVQALVADGRVRVDGHVARKSDRLEVGQKIEVRVPPPEKLEAQPEDLELDVLFEDPSLLVVNKPSGMVTHPAPGHPTGTLVNALLAHTESCTGWTAIRQVSWWWPRVTRRITPFPKRFSGVKLSVYTLQRRGGTSPSHPLRWMRLSDVIRWSGSVWR